MTIEEIDDPIQGGHETEPSFVFRSRMGPPLLLAGLAAVLLGITVSTVVPALGGNVGDRSGSVPTPDIASGQGPSAQAASGCQARPPETVAAGPAFVAIADQGSHGVAFVLSADTGAHRGRVDIGGSPQAAALDGAGRQLLLVCSGNGTGPHLISYDIATLRERWRVPITDVQYTKAPGGTPAVVVSPEGGHAFVMHYRALRADANAPGGSRSWMSVRDAHGGTPRAEVDLPECGVGSLHVSSAGVFAVCRGNVRVIDTTTWQVSRTYQLPATFRPVGLSGESRLLGVTRELRVVGIDLASGALFEDSSWANGTRVTANAWGNLAISADGCCLWVLAKGDGDPNEFGPHLVTHIDLKERKRVDIPAPNVRGVGVVGTRMVYVADGRIHSTGGSLDTFLLSEPVEFWQILARRTAGSLAECRPTTTRDASGVITVDGNVGIIGETFTRAGEGSFLVVRRGAMVGDLASLQFTQIGTSAPATWVQYSASANPQPTRTPWGDRAAFSAGWKPIAFENSCWRLIVDGRDSGIVLGVGPG